MSKKNKKKKNNKRPAQQHKQNIITTASETVNATQEPVNKKSAPDKTVRSAGQPDTDTHVSEHDNNAGIYIAPGLILILFALVIFMFILKLRSDKDLANANSLNEQLMNTLITASENIARLTTDNAEQKKQIEALSMALNSRTEEAESQKKEDEESALPILYPVKGSASVDTSEPETTDGEDPVPQLNFIMDEGSYAIATGSGIISILSDSEDGLINIVIDHGNGYKTNYTGEGIALKAAGEEIKRGDALMIFTGDNKRFSYGIMKDDKSVDPVSVMVIDG